MLGKDIHQQKLLDGGNVNWYRHFGRHFLIKLNIFLAYDPAIVLQIYPSALKTMPIPKPAHNCLKFHSN